MSDVYCWVTKGRVALDEWRQEAVPSSGRGRKEKRAVDAHAGNRKDYNNQASVWGVMVGAAVIADRGIKRRVLARMPGNRAAVGISVPATRGRGRESLGGCRLVGTSQLTGRVDWREKNVTWALRS